jgi:hypothetical protein
VNDWEMCIKDKEAFSKKENQREDNRIKIFDRTERNPSERRDKE